VVFSLLAAYRRLGIDDVFVPKLELDLGWEEMSRVDKALTVILLVAVVAAVAVLIYVIVTPKQGEKFTEFYILGPSGKAEGYPRNLKAGQEATIILGIANHEYRTVRYIVEVWLVNATFDAETNRTVIHHMYFVDSFSVTLNHTDVTLEGNWTPQWETPYTFSISRKGEFKLWFLLFKDEAPPLPGRMEDYAGTEAEKRILDAVEGKILSLNLNLVVR